MAEKTNVVFWANQGPDDIIYRSEQDDLRTITSVTVPEHAVALFIRDGQLVGTLEPGRHTVTSANVPWLTKLYNLALGYKETPFKVWIVFISLKMFNGKWGIRSMIKAGKEYEVPIVLMANGDFQFRINDVAVFYTQVLGGLNAYTTGDVNSFMKSFINEQIIQQMNTQYYMDILENLEKASTNTKILIEHYFSQRGIELLSLKINEVLTTDEDRQKVFNYLQFSSKNGEAFRRYEVMEKMANAIGESTGGAAMGAGMLLFPQMYQQLQQQPVQGVQQQQQQQQQVTKVMCPTCGGLNEYPYKYCSSCGQPSPLMAPGQPVQAQQAAPAGAAGSGKAFKNCPYCGEDLGGLPKTPKFCPYCSEQIN
ncbi:MAG: SPFH domain-containing protein [Methanomassiliicoccaceae archaeon]|nr:SPFH domain-containing protein [Methanomassiliicoccaceae archaeon]MCL2145784.1 SPFH domain-containing protein [Methanomassiliicoccaceae archaeon]